MTHPHDAAQLNDLVDGRLSPTAADELRRRLHDEPELAAALEELRRLRAALRALPAPSVPPDFLARVRERAGLPSAQAVAAQEAAASSRPAGRVVLFRRLALPIAAAVGVALGAAIFRVTRMGSAGGGVHGDATVANAYVEKRAAPASAAPPVDPRTDPGRLSWPEGKPNPALRPGGGVPPGLRQPTDDPDAARRADAAARPAPPAAAAPAATTGGAAGTTPDDGLARSQPAGDTEAPAPTPSARFGAGGPPPRPTPPPAGPSAPPPTTPALPPPAAPPTPELARPGEVGEPSGPGAPEGADKVPGARDDGTFKAHGTRTRGTPGPARPPATDAGRGDAPSASEKAKASPDGTWSAGVDDVLYVRAASYDDARAQVALALASLRADAKRARGAAPATKPGAPAGTGGERAAGSGKLLEARKSPAAVLGTLVVDVAEADAAALRAALDDEDARVAYRRVRPPTSRDAGTAAEDADAAPPEGAAKGASGEPERLPAAPTAGVPPASPGGGPARGDASGETRGGEAVARVRRVRVVVVGP